MAKKKDGVRIRTIEAEDIDALLAIDRKMTGLRRATTYDVGQIIGGHFALSFVAEANDSVVGFILSSLTYVPEQVTEVCAILTVGVDPDYWRQGIATKLVHKLDETCHSKGIKMIRVLVDQHDSQLKGLFERMDFGRGRLVEYYKEV